MLDVFISGVMDLGANDDFEDLAHAGENGNALYLNKKHPNSSSASYYDSKGPVFFDKPRASEWGIDNGYWGWGVSFLDFDNDGDLDVAEVNGFDSPLATEDDGKCKLLCSECFSLGEILHSTD